MVARVVSRVSLWIGIVAALAIPPVPPVYRWFYLPRKPAATSNSVRDVLGAMLNTLNSIGDGIAVFLWVAGLAVTAAVASLAAFVAAWRAHESSGRKILCGLPVLLVAVMWVLMLMT